MKTIPEEVQSYLDKIGVENVSSKDIKKAMNFLEERGLLDNTKVESSQENDQ